MDTSGQVRARLCVLSEHTREQRETLPVEHRVRDSIMLIGLHGTAPEIFPTALLAMSSTELPLAARLISLLGFEALVSCLSWSRIIFR